jgi:hypothetical protein
MMVPLRTSESDAFPVAIGVRQDNARAFGKDGEAGYASAVPVRPGMGDAVENITAGGRQPPLPRRDSYPYWH